MSKIAERIYTWLAGEKPVRHGKRQYAASRVNRLNDGWVTQTTSANWELRLSLRTLRARAREAARDDSMFKKYLSMCRANIIGPKGPQLQSKARMAAGGPLNVDLNKKVEAAWELWGRRETCTISRRLDWLGVCRLAVTQLARDGECLVRKIQADNDFGFALKIINVDYLDEYFNTILSNGNRVIMSVEVDDNDRPVAYYLTVPASDIADVPAANRFRVRVPAEEMIHVFLTHDDECQTRGVTWFHSAMLDAKNYRGYNEGVITSARMAAVAGGFLVQKSPDDVQFDGKEDEDGNTVDPQIIMKPASFHILPPDMEFQAFDPKQPTQQHSAFSKTIKMDAAAGLDVSYFELGGDMEAVNFSSARVGLDASRENWKSNSDFFATMFCREVFHAWARSAWLAGALELTAKEFMEIQNPSWRTRGYKYIDPTKDATADVMKLENKLTTWTDIYASQGRDLVEVFEEMQAEQELAKQYNIDLTAISSVKVTDAGTAPEDESGPPAPDGGKTPPKREFSNGDAELLN